MILNNKRQGSQAREAVYDGPLKATSQNTRFSIFAWAARIELEKIGIILQYEARELLIIRQMSVRCRVAYFLR